MAAALARGSGSFSESSLALLLVSLSLFCMFANWSDTSLPTSSHLVMIGKTSPLNPSWLGVKMIMVVKSRYGRENGSFRIGFKFLTEKSNSDPLTVELCATVILFDVVSRGNCDIIKRGPMVT